MSESEIEKAIVEFAKKNGISTLKLSGPHDRGKADRLFMHNGKALFLEIKAPGKKPTELQKRFLRERHYDGFPATWVDDKDDGISFLFDHLLFDSTI
jgi:hypothetical protein